MSCQGRCPICWTEGVFLEFTAIPIVITDELANLGCERGSMIEMCYACRSKPRFRWASTGKMEIGTYTCDGRGCYFVVDKDGVFDSTWIDKIYALDHIMLSS